MIGDQDKARSEVKSSIQMDDSLYSTAQPPCKPEELLKEDQIRDIGDFFLLFENPETRTGNINDIIRHLRSAKEINSEVLIKILINVRKRNKSPGRPD